MLSNSDMKRLKEEVTALSASEGSADLVRRFAWTRANQMKEQEWLRYVESTRTPKSATRALESVLDAAAHPTESYIEERLLLALNTRSMMIGRVKSQHKVGPYRLDFAFPDVKLCVEADGKQFHSAPDDIARDQKRTKYLSTLGWTVLRFTGSQINRDLYSCVDRITTVYTLMCKAAGLPEPWEVSE